MVERLPEFIDPLALIKRGADMRGTIPVASMQRVVESVMAPDGEAVVELHFRREGGVATIDGSVAAELTLQCQSCLEPFTWRVDSQVKLGVVAALDEANRLPESHEPLLIDENQQLRLLDIVEDELLLALPIIPRHPECGKRAKPASDEPASKNPFGVLAGLKDI